MTIKIICNAYNDFVANNRSVVGGNNVFSQKKVYQKLQAQKDPFCFRGFVSLKANRILGYAPSDSAISKVIEAYTYGSSKSYALTFTHIRTISNHWCTRSRFGAKNKGCAFGCGHISDTIKHSCICPMFWDSFFAVSAISPISITLEEVATFSLNSVPTPDSQL